MTSERADTSEVGVPDSTHDRAMTQSEKCKAGLHPTLVLLVYDGAGVDEPFAGWVCDAGCGARLDMASVAGLFRRGEGSVDD